MLAIKILSNFMAVGLSLIFSIITFIYGWGMEPKSWLVIIFVGFFGTSLILILNAIVNIITD